MSAAAKDQSVETIPVLPSLDLEETSRFYGELLGFDTALYRTDDYMIARRGTVEIHFRLTGDPDSSRNSIVYIRGGGVDDIHAAFLENSPPGLGAYELKSWNMKEFHLRDPHGNLLRFGRIPPKSEQGA
jgi:catechol 2,3-dioxygenase-like lactoylglutathione lyase family enzyme